MWGNPLLFSGGGNEADGVRSVRLRSAASAYFNRTFGVAGNRKKWTWSGWLKRGTLGVDQQLIMAGTGTDYTVIGFQADNTFNWQSKTLDLQDMRRVTTQVFRDPSAYFHLIAVYDSDNATPNNTCRVYVNGNEVTSFSTLANPSTGRTSHLNNNIAHFIGRNSASAVQFFDGLLAEVHFIDGQALTPASFGEFDATTGVWVPKAYAGTYGTNGFYLDFKDNSAATAAAIGKDSSGNGNNWTPNNISLAAGITYDSLLDYPANLADGGNGRGNYCVLSPIDLSAGAMPRAPRDGNLLCVSDANSITNHAGTIYASTGKWYFEGTAVDTGNGAGAGGSIIGWRVATTLSVNTINGVAGDVYGVEVDCDNGSVSFYRNGTFVKTETFTAGTLGSPAVNAGNGFSIAANFGQRPFSYTPPAGFKALNTHNLPEPSNLKGKDFMDVVLDTGANIKTTADAVYSGSDFMEWIKDRANANNNQVRDTVRGNFVLWTNSDAVIQNYVAPTGNSVGWVWKRSVQGGLDILTYTGNGGVQHVPHNLGVAPEVVIHKVTGGTARFWCVNIGRVVNSEGSHLHFNSTSQVSGSLDLKNADAAKLLLHGFALTNFNGDTYVAYAFAQVPGYSKFGRYTGNGLANGPFTYCGFRPKYVLIKRYDAAGNWYVFDTSRGPFNITGGLLHPNTTGAEGVGNIIDILSNGFKVRDASSADWNASGGTYFYMAFAENPFKYSRAR